MFARARLTSAVELYYRERHAGQPLRVEPARSTRAARGSRRRCRPVSGTCSASRCRSDRRSGSCCTPSAASVPATAAGRGCRSARSCCTWPWTTTARCRSSRRRARTSSSSGPVRTRPRAKPRRATTCTSRFTAGASRRSTPRAFRRGRSRRRSSSASTILPAGRSGRRSELSAETYQVYFTNDRARIYAIGYPHSHAVRPPGASGRSQHARGRGVRARAAAPPRSSPGSAASGRAWAARSCARFAPASTASCFWPSCSPRSSRC